MKKHYKILFTLALIFIFNVGFANTTGNEKKSNNQEQEKRRKADQTIEQPDGDASSQQTSEDQEEATSEPQIIEVSNEADSVEDDSVSKYNFIFYFLYKFKYGEEALKLQ